MVSALSGHGADTARTPLKMAAPQPARAKTASKMSNGTGDTKPKSQMHRRSRTGCFTCRLRRKKCDEGSPVCTACRHLGLQCEYKRPLWWSNGEARRQHKEDIKNIIKRKKLAEKTSPPLANVHGGSPPPPSLSHSLPTLSDPLDGDRTRSASVDSHPSAAVAFNFNSPPTAVGTDCDYSYDCEYEYGVCGAPPPPQQQQQQQQPPPPCAPAAYVYPYEIDVKTERQMFVNDVPTLRESHVSTFSTYHTPPPPGTVLAAEPLHLHDGWTEQVQVHQERRESLSEEALVLDFFDFAHGPHAGSTRQVRIELDDRDQRLLDHFIRFVLPTIFPMLECNQHGSVGSDLILPALQSNSIYLHCCLSTAAEHLRTQEAGAAGDVDQDIMRHRCATIHSLCEALKRDEDHQQALEAALALIFFQCVVGRVDDGLLDIAWHQHFQAAINLVQKLDLPRLVSDPAVPLMQTPFNMTLTAWIDILGATMKGTSPTFAHTYREKHLSHGNHHLGLRELMGCEDRVMYLISEIACLESLKREGMDDLTLCQHVSVLGEQMSLTEANDTDPKTPLSAKGSLSPKQLSKNMTAAFRLAARIYLCSLVPGFTPHQPSAMALVEKLTDVLQHIPSGPEGFDRSLVWVYLMGGSISLPGGGFRALFEERIARLGEQATCGSFWRAATVLGEVWMQNDNASQVATPGSSVSDARLQYVHWRDVMQTRGWDYLLI